MNTLRKCIRPLIWSLCCVAFAACASGQGCQTQTFQNPPPCVPNTIPCAHCTGTWTDNYGWTYNLTSNNNPPAIGTYNVTGTMQAPAADCSVVYQVSGTITQYAALGQTSLSITGGSPNPSGDCPIDGLHIADLQGVSVNITNNGCDYASGTWDNSDGLNGRVTMTKPADVPDGNPAQATRAVCWLDQCTPGFPWTVVLFEDTIQSTKSMAGRQAYEWQNFPGNIQDNCQFPGTRYPNANGGLTGGGWYVGFYFFDNRMDYDYVGMGQIMIDYYNGLNGGMNRVPCVMNIGQNMSLFTNNGSSQYFNDTLTWSLQNGGWYGVAKNGIQAWRQYNCGRGTCQPQ